MFIFHLKTKWLGLKPFRSNFITVLDLKHPLNGPMNGIIVNIINRDIDLSAGGKSPL